MSRCWRRAPQRCSPPRPAPRNSAATRSFSMAPAAGAGSSGSSPASVQRTALDGPDGVDTRFVVTNLSGGSARTLYERTYCKRGQAENHIKAWKRHLAADRTSCSRATANQFRLMLHTGAYWLMWSLRSLMPKRSFWRTAQFDTLRLRLLKIAAQVATLK